MFTFIPVYIIGPYRASTPWDVERNIRAAEEAAYSVAAIGGTSHLTLAKVLVYPVCPHSMYRYFDKTGEDAYWLSATTDLLKRCRAALTINGWMSSTGALAEVEMAQLKEIPVFHLKNDNSGLLHLIHWALEEANKTERSV